MSNSTTATPKMTRTIRNLESQLNGRDEVIDALSAALHRITVAAMNSAEILTDGSDLDAAAALDLLKAALKANGVTTITGTSVKVGA